MTQSQTNPPQIVARKVVDHHSLTLATPMKQWKIHQRIPPVLLLTGPSGIGKRAVALFLSQWISCKESGLSSPSDSAMPCGHCVSCVRFLSGNEVDFLEIKPDAGEDSESNYSSLKIDQFRKLKEKMGYSTHENLHKVILISQADRLTVQAANSVLKLLEETPKGWIFLLTATDATLLLPTLVSRCQTLRLKPFSREKLEELLALSEIPQEKRKICATLAQGSWDRALSFAGEDLWEQRKLICQFLKEPGKNLQAVLDWTSTAPFHFDILLDLLEQTVSEFLIWLSLPSNTTHSWSQSDCSDILLSQAKFTVNSLGGISQARSFWLERMKDLSETRQRATVPVNRKILIQTVLLPWMATDSSGGKA